jgi:hypothetical protein
VTATGPQGAKGDKGDRGAQGLSRRFRYGLVVLFALAVLAGGVGAAFGVRGIQLANEAAGKVSHHNALCHAIGRLAAEQPPGGSAAANPSRAYEQGQHTIFVQLHNQLGCTEGD